MGRLEPPRGVRCPGALASRSREPTDVRQLWPVGERGSGAELAYAPGLWGARCAPQRGSRELRAALVRDRGAAITYRYYGFPLVGRIATIWIGCGDDQH